MKGYIVLGSSVIRLLHAYIGNEAFRRGLSNYLAEYAYQNTITDKLWSHLSKASNQLNLSDILSTWTKQMGYPLLTVCLFLKHVRSEFI
jgi:aminopeptidase N